MKYRLLVTDYDGTLSPDSKSVSEEDLGAIEDVVRGGGKFALCTGRMTRAAEIICENFPFKPFVIAYNGAEIEDYETGKILFHTELSSEQGYRIARFGEESGVNVQIYDDETFIAAKVTEYTRIYNDINRLAPKILSRRVSDYIAETGIRTPKVVFFADAEKIESIRKDAWREFGGEVEISSSTRSNLEFMPKGVNKGFAVRKLCETLGISPEETVAVGDERNDVPMIKFAGIGVAVGGARDEVKAAADYVTRTEGSGAIKEVVGLTFPIK